VQAGDNHRNPGHNPCEKEDLWSCHVSE
jgi:hypothetical protein